MSDRSTKRQKTEDDIYHVIYWPGAPGRGEFVRLALEEAGAKYTDSAQTEDAVKAVMEQTSDKNIGNEQNPPPYAPPMLQHGDVTLSQTANILLYLGQRLNLAPAAEEDPNALFYINELTLTILDGLCSEPHDVHHPVAIMDYYEDQKDVSLRRAKDYRANRLPKFLAYFERVLSGPASKGGEYMYGGKFTYADLVLFQALDGVSFAFPKRIETLRTSGKYEKVFALYEKVKNRDRIKDYLASDRRIKYAQGIYRYYSELDEK